MEHLIGYVIIALSILSIALAWVLVEIQWRKKLPQSFYRDVGIRYMDGAAKPWVGMELAIDAIYEVLEKHPEYVKARAAPFWIRCYPYVGDLITNRATTGFTDIASGRNAPKPRSEEEAVKVYRLAGTMSHEKKWPWSKSIPIILVKELRHGDTPLDERLSRGTGKIKSTGWTALHHEHAEHFVSELVYKDENQKHVREDLKKLKEKFRVVYNARHTEER